MATTANLFSAAVKPFQHFGRLRDFATTISTELIVLAAGFAVLRLAARYWGPSGFGEYVLYRRNIGLLQLPLSCSMALGIARYAALARTTGRSERAYGIAALTVVATTLGVAAIAGATFSGELSQLLFGAASYTLLLRALLVTVTGSVLHGVAYGIFRGRLDMRRANTLQFINLAVVPLLAFSRRGYSVEYVATFVGAAWIAVSLLALSIGICGGKGALSSGELRHAMKDLLRYGIPRVPGEFALSALFTLPVTIMAHMRNVEEAGFLGFGVSLLTMIASLFTPLGLIMLPSVAMLVASNDVTQLRRQTIRVTVLCLSATAAGLILLEIATPWIVTRFLGSSFVAAIPIVRTVLPAALPYVCYIVLRNVLDAAHERALNARNLLVTLALFLGAIGVFNTPTAIPILLAISILLVGILTAIDSWRTLGAISRRPSA